MRLDRVPREAVLPTGLGRSTLEFPPALMTDRDVAARLAMPLARFRRRLATGAGLVPPPSLCLPTGEYRWELADVEGWLRELREVAQ